MEELFINNSAGSASAELFNLERRNIQTFPISERFAEIEICARNV